MKIALIGTLPEADRDAHRGPERTTIGLAESLDGLGHDVLVVADEGDAETVDTPARVIGRDLTPGVDRLYRFYRRIDREIDLDSFDVVHSWRPAPDVDVFSFHSVHPLEHVENRLPGTYSRRERVGAQFEHLGKRYTANRAERVVATAHPNAVDAARNGIDPDRVVPVGVGQSFVRSDVESENGVTVLCVARIEPKKNQRFVAAATPEEYDLELAGTLSSPAYADTIPGFTDDWIGELSHEELIEAYRRADVFVLPSIFEGFGLTAVEAMATGTPVVVADSCGIADHFWDEPIGAVYEFGNQRSYRRQLEHVMNNSEEYGENAREYVREKLNWDAIAEQYDREYRWIRGADRSG